MSLLKNRLLPLRTITLRYIARNLELFWKKKWDPELLKITKASDDILLNLPSVIRLEIFLYYCKTRFMHIKTLLLLLDHRTFSEELDELRRLRLDRLKQELDTRYIMTLLARRCKESTSLVLDAWSFFGDPSFGEVLGTFTELTSLRLYTTNSAIVKVIGTSLHNLEQLYLDDLMHDNFDDIKYLVTGCPQLRILHIQRGVTLESAEHVLLGLPNLVEFKHPLMVLALEKIILGSRADRVSAIRNLYIRGRNLDRVSAIRNKNFRWSNPRIFSETYVYKPAQVVIKHLNNITILDIIVPCYLCKESLNNLSVTVCNMNHLTDLTWEEFSGTDTVFPIIKAVGHQLRLLDLCCKSYNEFDVIDQCRKLRVLRISNHTEIKNESHDSDLLEQFTPFKHLQELHLTGLNNSHLKPALLKSLIASPVLRDLKLVSIPIFTDNIVEAAFSHVNEDEEQLAFTSLRKLVLWECDCITKSLEKLVVTREGVPLELLSVERCLGVFL